MKKFFKNLLAKKDKQQEKNDCPLVYDKNKIYNLDKQFIANILWMKLPNQEDDKETTDKFVQDATAAVLNYLEHYLGRQLNDDDQNEKIEEFIKSKLKNVITEKQIQNVGLLEIDTEMIFEIDPKQNYDKKFQNTDLSEAEKKKAARVKSRSRQR